MRGIRQIDHDARENCLNSLRKIEKRKKKDFRNTKTKNDEITLCVWFVLHGTSCSLHKIEFFEKRFLVVFESAGRWRLNRKNTCDCSIVLKTVYGILYFFFICIFFLLQFEYHLLADSVTTRNHFSKISIFVTYCTNRKRYEYQSLNGFCQLIYSM